MSDRPEWENVSLVVTMEIEDQKICRVFERDNKEYWFGPTFSECSFVGVNEAPDFGEHHVLSGAEAMLAVEEFLSNC